jgi:hypothetical protein
MEFESVPYHHPAANSDIPPPPLVQYHPSSNPVRSAGYFDHSMIGCALREWNSSLGIPAEAWFTIITAYVHCSGCNRVRSFDGDSMHRDSINGIGSCGGRPLAFGGVENIRGKQRPI